jgi:hypothetical protein
MVSKHDGHKVSREKGALRIAVALVASLVSTLALAQTPAYRQFNQRVKAGVPTRIYTVYNCANKDNNHNAAQAQHGTITVSSGRMSRCGYNDYPVSFITYTARPDYRGYDDVLIYSSTDGATTGAS